MNAVPEVASAARADTACYHCGLPVPVGLDLHVRIDGQVRPMCCAGCEAVAQAIVDNHLEDYYRHRDAMPESQREQGGVPEALRDLSLYDHEEFQRGFVRALDEHEREAALILEGITCAACVWLNEQHLAQQPGVTAVDINYATRRARVRWDERRIKLSGILAAVQAIGYRAHPYDAERSEGIAKRERRSALWRLFVAGFGMMQVMMYAIPAYLAGAGGMGPGIEQLMRWASMILTLPVMLYSAAPFFVSAARDLRLRRVGMDVPVALGIGTAFAASVWGTLRASGEVYFDSVTMFVFFLLGGRYLELIARQRAVRGVEVLTRAIPAFAHKLAAWPAREVTRVPVSQLAPGDAVLVEPGSAVPADGHVLDGESEADESLLTGESRPVPKRIGDLVTGGSINVASPLVVGVEHVGETTRLAAIQRLMERAAAERPRVVRLADRVAVWFVAALLLLALATGGLWLWLDASRALWIFVAVLVVSCPCALSLATPAALTVATGAMSRLGVLVTRGHAIETLARATHVAFDKTGTLTYGRMRVVSVDAVGGLSTDAVARLAAALEQGSEHAIAHAVRLHAAATPLPAVAGLRAVTGAGVEGRIDARTVRLGKPAFVAALHGQALPDRWQDGDGTLVTLGDATGWLGAFRLADEMRPEAAALVAQLRADGLRVLLLSGDTPAAVQAFAARLGIEDAHGGLSPEDKRQHIVRLQRDGAVVAMVGDGVNDAPVLAQAQVSVAMGGGTELARTQGDIVLLTENIAQIHSALRLARRTLRVIRINLGWSFIYNLCAIPLAMAGWVTPWMAGLGMSASSLLVVLNALRLQRGVPALPDDSRRER